MKRIVIVFSLLSLLLGLLYWEFPYALKEGNNKANLIYYVILISGLLISISSTKLATRTIINYATTWVAIAIVLLISYSYKTQLLAVLIPNRPIILKDGSFVITASKDNHFHIEVTMDGKTLDCIVDTGASSIVIDPNDAKSIGIDPNLLNFNIKTETANGITYSARASVFRLKIGDIELKNEPISVNEATMSSCLLGMSFLNNLKKVTIEGDKMIMSSQ
jgi:aspartyl protease family protein